MPFSANIQILLTNSKLIKVAKSSSIWAEVIWKRSRKSQREPAVRTSESTSKNVT